MISWYRADAVPIRTRSVPVVGRPGFAQSRDHPDYGQPSPRQDRRWSHGKHQVRVLQLNQEFNGYIFIKDF